MYQAVYKCRLCGEVTQEGHYENLTSIESVKNLQRHGTVHICSDESIGIMDLQGFKNIDFNDETLGRATFGKAGD